MSQFYVGVKQVFAWPEKKGEADGYHVVYRYGQPDAYHSWSPKDEFERFYLPMGEAADGSRITQAMVDGFIAQADPSTVNGKMTVTNVTLRNGTLYAESSACVDPKNYNETLGHGICVERAKDRVWHLLGFALQWARNGLSRLPAVLLFFLVAGVALASPPGYSGSPNQYAPAVVPVYTAVYAPDRGGDPELVAAVRELAAEVRALREEVARLKAGVPAGAAAAKAPPADPLVKLRLACATCHGPAAADDKGGGFALFDQAGGLSAGLTPRDRQRAAARVSNGSMPPPPAKLPADDRASFAEFFRKAGVK